MASAIGPDTSLVILCNPNNPTGLVHKFSDVKSFTDTALVTTRRVLADLAHRRPGIDALRMLGM